MAKDNASPPKRVSRTRTRGSQRAARAPEVQRARATEPNRPLPPSGFDAIGFVRKCRAYAQKVRRAALPEDFGVAGVVLAPTGPATVANSPAFYAQTEAGQKTLKRHRHQYKTELLAEAAALERLAAVEAVAAAARVQRDPVTAEEPAFGRRDGERVRDWVRAGYDLLYGPGARSSEFVHENAVDAWDNGFPGVELERLLKLLVGDEAASAAMLPPRGGRILRELRHQGAIDSRHRLTTTEIAEHLYGRTAAAPGLKNVISKLRERGLVATYRGRGGGVWLTDEGRAVAAELE